MPGTACNHTCFVMKSGNATLYLYITVIKCVLYYTISRCYLQLKCITAVPDGSLLLANLFPRINKNLYTLRACCGFISVFMNVYSILV